MEPWEALDVDDSELSFILCPRKRQAPDPDTAPPSPPQPPDRTQTQSPTCSDSIFRPCSQLHRSQRLSASQPTPPDSQTLVSDSIFHLEATPPFLDQLNNSPRRIPGPAGTLQAAMKRRIQNKELLMQGDDGAAPIPTQEYIRRAVENDDGDDGDFALIPWVYAVDFVRREGLVCGEGAAIGTPVCAIRNGLLTDRVALMVAVIKSCNPNGLDGLMVTLKDPTGSIGASIHSRVLSHGSFGKDISVGAVLILQKVAVFSPARYAHYLNITLNNVVKVISKDTGPLSMQNCHVPIVKHSSLGGTAVSHLRGRMDGIMGSFRRSVNTLSTGNSGHLDVVHAADSDSNLCGREHSCPTPKAKETSSARNEGDHRLEEAEFNVEMTQANAAEVSKCTEESKQGTHRGYLTGSHVRKNSGASNPEEISKNAHGESLASSEEQKKLGVSGSWLPEWTDQQLEELLEYD
ncbi:hypothetical protein SAY87_007561 [Trapa incisa]|uniref:Homologous recombination OB-fold protein OB-fold domain-containing protein n=1 Tax=Trapa incisa TaxID=236973 RepID=A0AAN7QFE7_9MYRT|nr:hypothetical protein SAY87_007561 [Trapa incisa]